MRELRPRHLGDHALVVPRRKPAERVYAQRVLDAMKQAETRALVPVTLGLEVANVIGKAEAKGEKIN